MSAHDCDEPLGFWTRARGLCVSCFLPASILLLSSFPVAAQICLSAKDMDPATRSALEATARRTFDMASKGDVFNLKANAIPSVAANFAGIESAVIENKAAFAGATAAIRPPFLLQAQGTAALASAEFLCGVFNRQGQTRDSSVFVLTNLPPGNYGVVIVDVNGAKGPYTLSFIFEQMGNDWKLGGFYAKSASVAGHNAQWYIDQARQYKAKGAVRNAWLYYLEGRELIAPVPFMSTLATDQLYDEMHKAEPSDFPNNGNQTQLLAGGKTYKLTAIFPLAVGNDLDLVVKYQSTDVSNTTQAFQDNVAVIKAIVARYPELRQAFAAVVARAVESSGRDYGTLLAMKDIK